MNKLVIEAVKSKIITPKDDLLEVIIKSLKKRLLHNGDILVVSSKVVAVTQGRISKITTQADFNKLVESESDKILGGNQVTLAIKNGIFIPWSGIDRSNIQKGSAVLWPKDSFKVAAQLQKELKKIYKLKKLGIIISDSTCRPLRRGVSGIALGYAGFKGVNDLRGHKDLYNNKLKVTQQAVADNLATAAHLVMGEADESTPFTIISNAPVTFTDAKINPKDLLIAQKDCLFSPLYVN